MSRANVVCANVYIKIRSTGRRQNPGRALMKGAIMHFSLVTTDGRTLERTTYGPARRHDCLLVNAHRARHYRTHFAIYRYATSSGRCVCPVAGRGRRLTAFYGHVIRSVTADRVIDVRRSSVRPSVCQPSQAAFLISLGRRYLIIVERTTVRTAISLYDDCNINRHAPSRRRHVTVDNERTSR